MSMGRSPFLPALSFPAATPSPFPIFLPFLLTSPSSLPRLIPFLPPPFLPCLFTSPWPPFPPLINPATGPEIALWVPPAVFGGARQPSDFWCILMLKLSSFPLAHRPILCLPSQISPDACVGKITASPPQVLAVGTTAAMDTAPTRNKSVQKNIINETINFFRKLQSIFWYSKL